MKTSVLCFSVLVLYVTGVQSLPNLLGFDPNIFGLKTVVHLMKSVFDAGVDILRPTDKHYDNNVLIVYPKASNDFKQLDEKLIFEDNKKRNEDHAKYHLGDIFTLKYNPFNKIFETSIESSPLHVIEKVTSNVEPLTNILLKRDPEMEQKDFPRHGDEKLSKKSRNIKNERNNFDNDEKFYHENTEFDKSVFEKEIYEENRYDNNRGSLQQYKNQNNEDFAIEEEIKMTANFDDSRVDINGGKIGKKRRPTLEMSGKSNFPVINDDDFVADKEDKHHKYNQGKELSKKYTLNMRKPSRHIYEPSLTVEKSERNDRLVDQTKPEFYDTRIFDKTKSVGENEEFYSFDGILKDGVMEQDVTENFNKHDNYYRNGKNNNSNQPIVSRKKTFSALDERSNERDKVKSDVQKFYRHYIYKDDDSMNHNREEIFKAPIYVLERPLFPETKLNVEEKFKILPESRHIPSSTANMARVGSLGFIEHNLDKPVITVNKNPTVTQKSNRKYNRG